MWIVRLALDRPYTFVVLALLILIATPLVVLRTPTDIFPNINIPVIAVGWSYSGLNPEEMEGRHADLPVRDITPQLQQTQQAPAANSAAAEDTAAKPPYPQEKLEEKLEEWRPKIDAGRTSPEHIIAMISSTYSLSDAQKDQIHSLKALEGQAA